MIDYFYVDKDGNIDGIGSVAYEPDIIQVEGLTVIYGIVPSGANAYINGEFITKPLPQSEVEFDVKVKRYRLLSASDWTQLNDVPLTQEQKNEWIAYRQALRDITQQPNFPYDIAWPVVPSG